MSAIESVLRNLESMDGPGKDIEAARLELAALRAEIHTRGVTIDHLVAQADSYRAAIKAADEMRRCYSEVWSGNHEAPSIVAYSRARAEIGE